MHPLLRLRQACCHPQVGGRLFLKAAGGGGPQTKAPMTMGEVLEVMLTKSRVEAEDAQVGGQNGPEAGSMDGVVTRCLRATLYFGGWGWWQSNCPWEQLAVWFGNLAVEQHASTCTTPCGNPH